MKYFLPYAAVIALTALVCYGNTLRNEFVWDDASSILLHQHIRDLSKTPLLFTEDLHAFGRGEGNFYRPLLALSFAVDYALSGKGPDGHPGPMLFHLSNLLWHALAGVLLLALFMRLGASKFAALAAALLFTAHPIQTEAVAYISGRGDSMAAAFMFAALLAALSQPPLRGAILSSMLFMGALLCKESAVIYPFLLAPLVFLAPAPEAESEGPAEGRIWRKPIMPLALSIILLAMYALLRFTVLHFGDEGQAEGVGIGQRLLQSMQALAVYAWTLCAPFGLHMERTLDNVPVIAAAGGIALLAALAALIIQGLRRPSSRPAMAALWFIITWAPISGVFPLNAPLAEHWLYVPMAGLAWLAGEALHALTQRGRTPMIYACVTMTLILTTCALFTIQRNRDWSDNETLFRATLAKNPNTSRVHFNLAVTYEDILGNMPGARRHYERIIALRDVERAKETPAIITFTADEMEARLSLGRMAMSQGAIEQAANHFKAVMDIEPNQGNYEIIVESAMAMAQCLQGAGDMETAQKISDHALKIQKQFGEKSSPKS